MEDGSLVPVGWFVGHALERLAELYEQMAEQERREATVRRLIADVHTTRAATFEMAAHIAVESAAAISSEFIRQQRKRMT